ncbi:hypothetical protein CAC42_4014 [Sphaceloma murrayae]|uniref:Uncharacterized protein n=1 Tax=Sphaceloma murrayae TaxID=2082308 RepID=A0A2K1QSN5_9PEZI|nr:hypothetical protein CAC42_4014 [Sphaceloma murrayae]
MPVTDPPTLTPAQLTAFYDRISLPALHRHLPSPSLTTLLRSPAASLTFLSALLRHSLATIPFENLSLHYSAHHTVSITPSSLYAKIVTPSSRRGGYCMENNGLFLLVCRSLGFDIYPVGAKVNESVSANDPAVPREKLKYSGWSHMVNLVTLPMDGGGEGVFLCDIGFGAGGPSRPLLVRDGETVVNVPGKTGGEEGGHVVRFVREKVAQTTRGRGRENEMWVFERRTEEGEFRPFYCFTEQEFFEGDFEVMSHATSTRRGSWFTYQVVCSIKILDEAGERVVGEVGLFEKGLKKRMFGETVETRVLKSEEERVKALEEYFGIVLSEPEVEGIIGMVSMIKPESKP